MIDPVVEFLESGGSLPRTELRNLNRPGAPDMIGIRKRRRGRMDDDTGMGLIRIGDRTTSEVLNPRWDQDKVTSYRLGGMLVNTRARVEEFSSGLTYTRL